VDLASILVCPLCRRGLTEGDGAVACKACGAKFTEARPGQLDLRPQRPLDVRLRFTIGIDPVPTCFARLRPNPDSPLKLRRRDIPFRIDRDLATWLPRAREPDVAVLDLACGSTHHRPLLELLGYRYVGVDIDPSMDRATLLADGQALPFRDACFGLVLSIATLEHVPHPRVMLAEIHRVLRPGGSLVGTVSFLEPFHGASYFHHTHYGVESGLREAGFEVSLIAAVPRWSGLDAQARMSLFPRLWPPLGALAIAPLKALHRAWWALGARVRPSEHASDIYRTLSTAGALCFVARKAGAELDADAERNDAAQLSAPVA
jgi:SAM-dependent methyltransferase